MHDETRLLHLDRDDEPFRALTTPVHRASTLIFPTVEDFLTRSEEHTSELQSLMRISYAVFCLKKKNTYKIKTKRRNTSYQPPNQHNTTSLLSYTVCSTYLHSI